MFTIQRATIQDTRALADLMGAFYRASGYECDHAQAERAFGEVLSDERAGMCWLMFDDQREVGYIAVSFAYSLEYFGRTAFIEDLYVAPDCRRQGLGRKALEVAEAACRQRGILALHLEVGEDNHPAIELYRRFGFRGTSRRLLNKRLDQD